MLCSITLRKDIHYRYHLLLSNYSLTFAGKHYELSEYYSYRWKSLQSNETIWSMLRTIQPLFFFLKRKCWKMYILTVNDVTFTRTEETKRNGIINNTSIGCLLSKTNTASAHSIQSLSRMLISSLNNWKKKYNVCLLEIPIARKRNIHQNFTEKKWKDSQMFECTIFRKNKNV